MVNCSRDKTNKTNFGEKPSNSIDTMARLSIVTLFADCVSLRLKGTRKERAYQLPIPHLMDELCRNEAQRAMIEKLKEPEM
jgi:hypothetical protein